MNVQISPARLGIAEAVTFKITIADSARRIPPGSVAEPVNKVKYSFAVEFNRHSLHGSPCICSIS